MAPAAVRTPTRKAIAALPETSRLNFLCAASKLVSETAPELSSYLGSRALQWADKRKLPAPRVSPGQLCDRCGAYCTATGAALVRLSSQYRRRRRQQQNATNRGPEHTVAAIFGCHVCGSRLVRTFVGENDARKMFPKAQICNSLQHQLAASQAQRAGNTAVEQHPRSSPQPGQTGSTLKLPCMQEAFHNSTRSLIQAATPEALLSTAPHMAAATPAAQTAQSADQHSQHAPQDAKQAGHDLPDEVSAEISVLQTSQPEATAQVPAVSEDVQQQPTSLRNGGSDCSEPMQLTPAVPDDLPLDQAKESASSADPLADTNRGNSEADQAVEVAASPVHARHPIEHLEAINMAQSAEGSHCHSAQESIYSSVPSAPDACDKHDAVKVVDVTNAPAAAAVAGILPAKHKSPDKPEHISNSSTVSGQGQGLQTTRLEAPAEAVMEGSASRTGQDAAVQDMHTEEQQHLPLNIVPAAAQSTMPPVQADTYQKPATFSWHKVGKTWKPRKLPGSKRRRASLL